MRSSTCRCQREHPDERWCIEDPFLIAEAGAQRRWQPLDDRDEPLGDEGSEDDGEQFETEAARRAGVRLSCQQPGAEETDA